MDQADFNCSLCLDLVSDNGPEDYFVSTECGHIFHYLCLKPAYESGYKLCPICRNDLNLQNLRKLYGLSPSSPSAPPCLSECQPKKVEREYDYKFKIIIVGDSGVGKSSLLQRYADGAYNSKLFSTIGCDWVSTLTCAKCKRSKTLVVGGKIVNLSMWDTVGQERHRSLVTNYVRDAHGALIVYDITNEDSFSDIEYWIDFVSNHGLQDCAKILIGNKTDLDHNRQVLKADGKALAHKCKIPYFETSAKDSYNVEAAFRTLAAKILDSDALLCEVEEKRRQVGTLRLSKDQQQLMPNPLSLMCSYSWHWTKVAARGIQSGWSSVTSNRSTSRRNSNQ